MGSLFVALVLLLFSNGRWPIAAAAWLSPPFLLRYLRTQKSAWSLLIAGVFYYGVQCVVWRGLVPAPGVVYYLIVAGMLLGFLPFILDRLIAPRVVSFASTLVFPCAWVAAEYATAMASPYATWGNAAYVQADDLPLIQLVSVTGLWGVGFLIAWSASVVNWAWERHWDWPRVKGGILGLGCVVALVYVAGGARLIGPAPAPQVVRVASFTETPQGFAAWDFIGRRPQGAALDTLRRNLLALQDTLFAWSRREARAGAKLVTWSEANFSVLKEDEENVISRGAALAREEGITLVMAISAFTPGAGYYENQVVICDPSGRASKPYHKARPVPGDPERGADREIPVMETPFGRMAAAICFDMDFPQLIRKAGRQRAELMVAPSSDWRDIDPIHTRMALFRGIENGCPVVRQTNKGLSAVADDRGRILAEVDFFRTRPDVMVAQVPVGSSSTIYSKIGDLFAYLCVAALAFFATMAVTKRAPRPSGLA